MKQTKQTITEPDGRVTSYDYQTDVASPGADSDWVRGIRATNPRLSANPIIVFTWRVGSRYGWQKLYLTRSGLPVGWDPR